MKRRSYATRLRLSIKGDTLTLRPPRFALALTLGAATGLLIFAYGLSSFFLPPAAHETPDPLILKILKAPWSPVPIGFIVFLLCNRLFRDTIVLDRKNDALIRRGKTFSRLADIASVEVEDYRNVQRMNGMAFVMKDAKRFQIMVYDGPADSGLKQAAADIAGFIGVKMEILEGGSLHRIH